MPPIVATAVFVAGILGLFWLDRNPKVRTSAALWLPTLWIGIACSRTVAQWLRVGPSGGAMTYSEAAAEGTPLDMAIFTFMLAISLGVIVTRKARVERILRANWPILLFFSYCALSVLWSDFPSVACKRLIKAMGDLIMVLIVMSEADPWAAFRRLVARLSYVLLPLSVLLIKYFPQIGRQYGFWLGETYYVGVTNNKNTLGTICMLFGLVALWRILDDYRGAKTPARTQRMAAQALTLVIIVYLFRVTNSMTALTTFVMGSFLLWYTGRPRAMRKPALVHLLVVAIIAGAASVAFLDISPEILRAIGRNPTLTGRTEIWGTLLSHAGNPVLGTGFESYWLGARLEAIWAKYWFHPNEAHNGYLEIYLNLGWVGIVLLATVLVTGYQKVFRRWSQKMIAGNLWLAYFAIALVFNFTEAAFFRMQAPVWIFCLFAITATPQARQATVPMPAQSSVHDLRQSGVAGEHAEIVPMSAAAPPLPDRHFL